ncbi:MAG TPA: alpha/beta fold hydrolase [Streptosporangiaceae bacterium]|jgi:pimeloyl-ACP methyl ester carboxylesterase|nr:alpha/beta fold hydrolase [Streptosporangiaceae bacterium]
MPDQRLTVGTPDGRQLEVLLTGPADGLPLLFHTGTPGGLVPCLWVAEAAAAHGLRTVLYARPGYGGSTPQPGRRVADCAADVTAILDRLGAAEFLALGWSGGGPHALASAALTGGRCRAVVSLAGVAPRGAAGLDWLSGMGPENIEELAAAEDGPDTLGGLLTGWAAGLAGVTGAEVAESMGGLLSAADRAVLTGEFAEYLAASFRAALSTGVAGWRDDDLAVVSDWGFGAGDVAGVPAAIWQGGQDRMVPLAHGAWLGAQVPGASVHLLPGEGHLTLITGLIGQVLAELASLAGLPARGSR